MPMTSRRRSLGSYYTPDWIARWMIAQALANNETSSIDFCGRILDPACGDGGFILPILDALSARLSIGPADAGERLRIVREHVFGVDADRAAIESLRQRVMDWIGDDSPAVTDVVQRNFPWGDALLGEDWAHPTPGASVTDTPTDAAALAHPRPLHWSVAFPQIAAAGGFDVVIGNPPYRRELNAKADFDRIAESTLGQRRRTARMDLWHYFLHRGLDLLKPGGRLSFIVNSYWTSATAAKGLRQRLASETALEELVLLGSARLFPEVSGRHLIFQVRKGADAQTACRVRDLSHLSRSQIESMFTTNVTDSAVLSVPQADLWSGGQLRVPVQVLRTTASQHPIGSRGPALGDLFEVRQGIAENPPFVTRAAAAELNDPSLTGRGVFVLTDQEVAALELSPHEQSLLRHYYSLSAIGRFLVAPQPTHWILYLTRHTAPDVEKLPRIAVHLHHFRSILQRRREVQSGQIAWWHLHWPREERLFISPRVLCHQMGHEPRFAYAEQPTFVGFSLHVIVARAQTPAPLSLPALAAILNSQRGKNWFETVAKRRGAHLDISGGVLKQFSLPETIPPQHARALDSVARNWANFADEKQLNLLVDEIYAS